MNALWKTSDNKPFFAAEWNNGFLKYAHRFALFWGESQHVINSPLQPGKDGKCAAILYFREYEPSWVMLPCRKLKSRYWICKSQPRVHSVIQRMGYPSLWCRVECLLLSNSCYEHKLLHRNSNDIGCNVADPYLLHLSNNLANYGIDVLFFMDCTDVELRKKSKRSEMDDKTKNRWAYVKKIQLQETDTNFVICGPAMQRCDDGSCRAQSIICIFDFQCVWNLCACTTSSNITESIDYCRYWCSPGICTCSPLMFQCSTRGCIPYSHVCDNVYDCADTSDEFCIGSKVHKYSVQNTLLDLQLLIKKSSIWCFGFICSSGLCIDVNFVDDLIPDCSDAEDESHSLAMKYNGLQFYCDDMQEIPCVPNHSKCFRISHLCVYDHDTFGHISHCRDGAHLLNCRYATCTNMFKCPRSYCIPIRKVCDGIYDCYAGEDENNCRNNICPGYLKCRAVEFCIHPTEVCDGYPHCPHGDDEEICDFFDCPKGCGCLGHSVVCKDERFTYIPKVTFQGVIYLARISGNIYSPTYSNLSSISGLVILDLSSSNIVSICPGFQKDYTFYGSMHALHLEHNRINYISPFCFTKLLSLLVINLGDNPLVDIADDAFKDISLNVLVIKDTLLSSISGQWIDGFYTLKALDIRRVKLNHFSHDAANSLNRLEAVYTDDPKICCILSNIIACHDHMSLRLKCSLIMFRAILSPILMFTTVTILVFITFSLWLVANQFIVTRPVQHLLHNRILINRSLCVFYVLAIVVIDSFQGKHYIFRHRSLSNKLLCQVLQVILSCGILMCAISTSLLDHIAYMAVSRMQFNKNEVHGVVKKLLCLMHFLVITIFSLITSVLYMNLDFLYSDHYLCGAAFGKSFNDQALSVAGPVFSSIGIILSLAHSIFTYSVILKNAYSSGKRVQTMSSTNIDKQWPRLFKLLKTLSHFIAFRSLECLPIISIVFLELHGTDVSIETKLMSIIISIVLGCVGNTIPLVWYPTLRQNNKWTALPWTLKVKRDVRSQ